MVERSPEKAGVGGSTPSRGTIFSSTYERSKPWFGSIWFQNKTELAEVVLRIDATLRAGANIPNHGPRKKRTAASDRSGEPRGRPKRAIAAPTRLGKELLAGWNGAFGHLCRMASRAGPEEPT